MSVVRPFRALRPAQERASQVAAVPYDVVDQAEARKMAQGNSWSFLHISRPEIDFPTGTHPYSEEVYERAATRFQQFIRECPFSEEERPSLYLYRLRMGQHEQTGLVGCFSIDEYDSNQIKKHERTRKEKEDDRTRHITTLSAQTGPVFLTYRGVPEIENLFREVKKLAPLYDFTAPDGTGHTLWRVAQPEAFVRLFSEEVPTLYIADGHHRAAAASRVRALFEKQNSDHSGNEDYNFFLAVAFPDSQLKILPYFRVVKDLLNMTETEFLEKVSASFKTTKENHPELKPGEFGMYLKGQWYRLTSLERSMQQILDVALLQNKLLNPILGISDPTTDQRIEFVGGIRGESELERIVNSGKAAVAFSLYPTQMQDVMATADQGGIMPPKSTWFEPKLLDGLLSHRLNASRKI